MPLKYLDGMDSLLSIVQMPAGIPVATVAVGGARNAGLLAVRILAAADDELRTQMIEFQARPTAQAKAKGAALREKLLSPKRHPSKRSCCLPRGDFCRPGRPAIPPVSAAAGLIARTAVASGPEDRPAAQCRRLKWSVMTVKATRAGTRRRRAGCSAQR